MSLILISTQVSIKVSECHGTSLITLPFIRPMLFCNFFPWQPIILVYINPKALTQPAIICSKLSIETLEQAEKYVQS